jgi:hypothetical protein
MRSLCVLLLSCLAIQSAFAAETNLTLTVDGVTYSNVTFGTVTPSSVTIFFKTGVARIPLEKLSPDLQKRFGYDPQKARDHNQKVRAQEAAAAARQQELAQTAKQKAEFEATYHQALENIKGMAIKVVGNVQQITDDGVLIANAVMPYTYQVREVVDPTYHTIMGEKLSVTRTVTAYKKAADEYEPIFILGAGKGFTDGAQWSAIVYPAGTYKYMTVSGSGKTVKCFALSPDAALEHMLKKE